MASPTYNLNLNKADGIVSFNTEVLADDPCLIVGFPYPPGRDFFYVDDVLQIKAGCRIFYGTEAERNPQYIQKDLTELLRARKELAKYLPGTKLYNDWAQEVNRLSESVIAFSQGQKRVKSLRTVRYVDPKRKLIVVKDDFIAGFKPRVMSHVVRVVGFKDDQVNEVITDKIHKVAKELYGGYDWESEYKATGKLPNLR